MCRKTSTYFLPTIKFSNVEGLELGAIIYNPQTSETWKVVLFEGKLAIELESGEVVKIST